MKRSLLLARHAELLKRRDHLRDQKALHFTKREPEWQGKSKELGGGLDKLEREIAAVEKWLNGHWVEDDVA